MLRRSVPIGLVASVGAIAWSAAAQMYPDDDLEQARLRMGPQIELTVSEDIIGALPRGRRAEAASIRVVLEHGAEHPLLFYASPADNTVHVPMEAVRFLDDLSVLVSWFDRKGCRPEYIQTYLSALLARGLPLPPPLAAFGIEPATAYADPWVWDVSNKVFDSAMLFLLAHEVGHLVLRHRPGLAGAASQAQEQAADSFALDHFAAIGAPPAGIVAYFMAARWIDPAAGQAEATHPVSTDRLRAIAHRLAADPAAFASAEPVRALGEQQVAYIAANIDAMAEAMADPDLLTTLPLALDRDFPLSRIGAACPG